MSFPSSGSVLQGARSPYALVIHIEPGEKLPDLTAVASARLLVYRGNVDAAETWACDIASQSTTALSLSHVWVSGDNDDPLKPLKIWAVLTTNLGAEIYTDSVSVSIIRRAR